MKIYIAGTFADQHTLRLIAHEIWKLGHEVTGTWLNETSKLELLSSAEFKRKLAVKDIAEVYRADVVILDNRQSSGGKNVEWGISVGQFQHKMLWLVGEPSNIFHHLADRQFEDWAAVYEALGYRPLE